MDSSNFVAKLQASTLLMPKNGYCNDFTTGNIPSRKMVFLVPHVIAHRDHSEIIIWRCNWGAICDSRCVYANIKSKNMPNTTID
jgi:hypothetical protein